ncbi:MAG: putative toxin-antitoxin system toxin component, PIN family [Spirochaetia bacterium]
MNIVLDTNVLVSGLLSPRHPPAQILNLILNQRIRVLYDNRILAEYAGVLHREKFRFSSELIDPVIDFLEKEGVFVTANPVGNKLIDEGDVKFLEVALSGDADYLITGNTKHYPESELVITPALFIEKYVENC